MKSQLETIIDHLNETGEVSRNWCLQRYVSRLGARISDLKEMGWEFETETRPTIKPDGTKGKDYVYKVVKKPDGLETRALTSNEDVLAIVNQMGRLYKQANIVPEAPESFIGRFTTENVVVGESQLSSATNDYKGELIQSRLL